MDIITPVNRVTQEMYVTANLLTKLTTNKGETMFTVLTLVTDVTSPYVTLRRGTPSTVQHKIVTDSSGKL